MSSPSRQGETGGMRYVEGADKGEWVSKKMVGNGTKGKALESRKKMTTGQKRRQETLSRIDKAKTY